MSSVLSPPQFAYFTHFFGLMRYACISPTSYQNLVSQDMLHDTTLGA